MSNGYTDGYNEWNSSKTRYSCCGDMLTDPELETYPPLDQTVVGFFEVTNQDPWSLPFAIFIQWQKETREDANKFGKIRKAVIVGTEDGLYQPQYWSEVENAILVAWRFP